MAYDRFLIAPMESGLITDVKAWLIPEDAFARLENAYIHKGIVKKRFGSQLIGASSATSMIDQLASRLRIHIDSTDETGSASGALPGTIYAVGQMFSIGTEIFTINELGTPATLLDTGSATLATCNTTAGTYAFAGAAPNTKIYFYPSLPVTGFCQYETDLPITNPLYAFDQEFIYIYLNGGWERAGGMVAFKGDSSNLVWSTNWTGISPSDINVFITNFNATIGTPGTNDDPMYSCNNNVWTEFRPVFSVAANVCDGYVQTARMIIPFKNRLLLLNTIERNVTTGKNLSYGNRCRFSHNGSPFPADVPNNVSSAVSNAWLEVNQSWTIGGVTRKSDGAGWIDAPTEEEIMSAEFIKDHLIVYFEKSTWEIAYTGNEVQPFIWQKINSELGTLALKSAVAFDKVVFTIGNTGIHGCTGANIAKINEKIDDFTFEIRNSNDGFKRIAGIRDFFTDLVYWSYPSISAETYSRTFPNKVLIYNLKADAWGNADDCITAFGYFDNTDSITWQETQQPWQSSVSNWGGGNLQSQFKQVLAGNQQGFTFICDSKISENAAVMQITDIYAGSRGNVYIKLIDHTLNNGDYLKFIDTTGLVFTDTPSSHNYPVTVIDKDTVKIKATFSGTYLGGGRAARVSKIDILSKQWNLYIDKARNFYLAKIDFAVSKTTSGQISVDYYPSSSELSTITEAATTNAKLGDSILHTYPYSLYHMENYQKRLWHPVYFQTEGECVQIRIFLNDAQLSDQSIAESDFQLEGLILYSSPTSERLQ